MQNEAYMTPIQRIIEKGSNSYDIHSRIAIFPASMTEGEKREQVSLAA
jgi:hypothetical protein